MQFEWVLLSDTKQWEERCSLDINEKGSLTIKVMYHNPSYPPDQDGLFEAYSSDVETLLEALRAGKAGATLSVRGGTRAHSAGVGAFSESRFKEGETVHVPLPKVGDELRNRMIEELASLK